MAKSTATEDPLSRVVCRNRRARHEYHVEGGDPEALAEAAHRHARFGAGYLELFERG